MDWLKKLIDESELQIDNASSETIINEGDVIIDAELDHKYLTLAKDVYAKFDQSGKLLIQNMFATNALEFNKDILLVIYDFFNTSEEGCQVGQFLTNWPEDSHEELRKSIQLLINGEILVNPAIKTDKIDVASELVSPTIEKNLHINLINHHYMLKDYVRLAAYRRAIENNVSSDKIAMDLGSGTGILSFFAAKAGASKVYAIERRQDIVGISKEIAIENQIDSKIEYVIGNSTSITSDKIQEKVDVLISEILGSGILEENVIEFTIDARDRFCKPDATLIPCKLDIFAFGFDYGKNEDIDLEAQEIENIYDLKLSAYKKHLKNFITSRYERYSNAIYKIMTDKLLTKSIDLKTITSSNFKDDIELTVTEDGNLNAFCVYFSALLDEETKLTNSPWAPNTHWIQKIFIMPQPLTVQKGQKIPICSVYDGDYRIELRV